MRGARLLNYRQKEIQGMDEKTRVKLNQARTQDHNERLATLDGTTVKDQRVILAADSRGTRNHGGRS